MDRLNHFITGCATLSLGLALYGVISTNALLAACFSAFMAALYLFPVMFQKGRELGARETVSALWSYMEFEPEPEPEPDPAPAGDQALRVSLPAVQPVSRVAPAPVLPADWVPEKPLIVGGELALTLGTAVAGRYSADQRRPIEATLGGMGHILIGGAPRSGKSVLTRAILYQALLSNLDRQGSGDTVFVTGIDLTGITLNPVLFEGLPQLFAPIASTREEADQLLDLIETEARRREERFRSVDSLPEKLSEYVAASGDRLPYVIVFVEEFGALSLLMGKEWQNKFTSLVWRVAKYGFHFVCLSQDLTKATVGPSRDAFLARIWFRDIPAATRQMLGFRDEAGVSENVPGRGWLKLADAEREFQGLFVKKQQLIDLVKLLKERETN